MRHGKSFRITAATTLMLFGFSCATTQLPPISTSGADFQPLDDERQLWEQAREEEAKLHKEAPLYPDPLLEDYLEEVVANLNPPGMAANPWLQYRVSVIERPTLNAFAYPTGSIYVHTGLLARMENEAQLATVLGHEMTHVEDRHMVRYQRATRNKQIAVSAAAIAAAVILAEKQGEALERGDYSKAATIDVIGNLLIGLGLTLAVLAAVNGYGRDLEREADQGSFEKLTAAGYDPAEAPKVYQELQEDHGESGKLEIFFFGDHPKLSNRIESAEQWLAAHLGPQEVRSPTDPDRFTMRIRPVIRDDARLNIAEGRLQLAEDQLNRVLALMPEDPQTHFLFGQLRVKQSEAEKDPRARRDLEQHAAAAFRESIRLDPERPSPHRELGLLAYRTGDFGTACAQFKQYVELDPKAEDAQRIRDYQLELKHDGYCS